MKKDWDLKTLGEVCDISMGKTPPRNNKVFWDIDKNTKNIWVSIADMSATKGFQINDSKEYVSDAGAKLFKPVPKGTLLASFKLSLGKIAFAGTELRTNEAIVALKNEELQILNNYLYYYLTYFDWDDYAKEDHKVKGKTLNKEKVKAISVKFPRSKNEQKRIVMILDEKFKAIEKLKTIGQEQLASAKELFESNVSEIFAEHYHQDKKLPLSEMTTLITKGSSPKWQGIKYVNEGEGILFVTSKNVGIGNLLMENATYLEKRFNEIQKRSILQSGDVLTNIVGASIGRTAIYDLESVANINQAVCVMRCNEKLLNKFLVYLLNSRYFIEVLHANEVNNARANLSLSFFSNLEIPQLPIDKQVEIVNELNKLSEKAKELEVIFQRKIADLEELKKSYLNEAFSGKL